jgi:hypothetical protein
MEAAGNPPTARTTSSRLNARASASVLPHANSVTAEAQAQIFTRLTSNLVYNGSHKIIVQIRALWRAR